MFEEDRFDLYSGLEGQTLRIFHIEGRPEAMGKVGTVKEVDDAGLLHGTWGDYPLDPTKDRYQLV